MNQMNLNVILSSLKKDFSLVVLGSFVLLIQFVQLFWLSNMQNPIDAFRLQLSFSREEFLRVTENWTQADQSIYLMHYMFDFFYPALYALFLFLVLKKMQVQILRYAPLAAASFDVFENVIHFMLLSGYLSISNGAVMAGGLFASFKWLFVLGSLFLVVTNLRKRFKEAA